LRIKARLPVAWHLDCHRAGLGRHRLAAIAVARVANAIVTGQMVVHLRVQRALGQRLLERIKQAALLEGSTGGAASQPLVEKVIGNCRFFASRHRGLLVYPLCPTTHGNPDTPSASMSPPSAPEPPLNTILDCG